MPPRSLGTNGGNPRSGLMTGDSGPLEATALSVKCIVGLCREAPVGFLKVGRPFRVAALTNTVKIICPI